MRISPFCATLQHMDLHHHYTSTNSRVARASEWDELCYTCGSVLFFLLFLKHTHTHTHTQNPPLNFTNASFAETKMRRCNRGLAAPTPSNKCWVFIRVGRLVRAIPVVVSVFVVVVFLFLFLFVFVCFLLLLFSEDETDKLFKVFQI